MGSGEGVVGSGEGVGLPTVVNPCFWDGVLFFVEWSYTEDVL